MTPGRLPTDTVSGIVRRLGRELVLPRFGALETNDVSEKAPGDLVTVVDREVEAELERELAVLMRGSRVVGEERATRDPSVLDDLGSGWVWIVDPLDGTSNFVEGHPTFGIMVGLLSDGEAVAGWIHTPALRELAVAEAGRGATLNGEPLTVAPPGPGQAPRDMASIRYVPPPMAEEWRRRDLGSRFHRGYGASAVDYPRLLAGDWTSLFFWRTLPWDHVAGTLLVREAGGHVARLDGSAFSPVDGKSGLLVAADEREWTRVRELLPEVA